MHVDLDFFDGRKGGHMSISGISGVATKTSFALFFLRMLTASPQVLGEGAANLRVLVFNVKGEDLLWLDKPNRLFDDAAAEGWAALGVEASPFPSVRFWAPPRRRSGDVLLPDTGGRQEGVDVFTWTPREFIDEELLRFLFTDANDQRNQIPFVRERVTGQLKRWAVNVTGMPGAVVLRDPPQGGWSPGEQVQAAAEELLSSATCRRWSPRSRIPRARGRLRARLRVERQGDAAARSARSCGACTRRRRASGTWCAPARATGSTGARPASPSWRSSRCTSSRSGSWWARC